jgi:hypothetical protein
LIAVAANRTAVMVAAATGQGRRIFACGTGLGIRFRSTIQR